MDIVLPLLVTLILATLCIAVLGRDVPRRVVNMVVVSLLIRLALALMFALVPATRIFHDDAGGYENLALAMSRYWHGAGPPISPDVVVNFGYQYWSASLMYVFGGFRAYPSCLNALIGAITGLIVYRIGRQVFVEAVAYRATLFALFFPSMILWSSIAVKDPMMVFLLVVCMNSVLQLRRRLSVMHVLVVGTSMVIILTLRFYMFYMTGLAIALSLTVFSGQRMAKSMLNQLLLLVVLGGAFVFFGLRQDAQDQLAFLSFEKVAALRTGLATTANSSFQADADVSTPAKAIAFMPVGVLFLLFSPFPWQITSLRPILTIPEMLVWWGMTGAWIRGIRFVLRTRDKHLMPMIVFAVIMTLAYSTVHGNAGTAFRQRSQIMIFLFLMAALGQYVQIQRLNKLPEGAVLASWTPPEPLPEPGPDAAAPVPVGPHRQQLRPVR